MQSHIRKVYACLAVTCHLRFWQNDRGLLRATAVTRGWNGYRNKSQHRKWPWRRKFSRRSSRDSNPRPFDHESGAPAVTSTWAMSWLALMSTEKRGEYLMLSRDEGSKLLHRFCRHYFFCQVVPFRNSCDEEAVSEGVCFCTDQREAVAVVSGEPPDDVAGGEVRSAGGLDLPLVPHRCQKEFCWNGWDETFGNYVEEDEALLSPSVL